MVWYYCTNIFKEPASSTPFYSSILPSRWKQQVFLKCWCHSNKIHGITPSSQFSNIRTVPWRDHNMSNPPSTGHNLTTIFSGLFATTLSLQLTQNCKMCRNTACDAMCLSHILLVHFHLNCVSSIPYSAEKCWHI